MHRLQEYAPQMTESTLALPVAQPANNASEEVVTARRVNMLINPQMLTPLPQPKPVRQPCDPF